MQFQDPANQTWVVSTPANVTLGEENNNDEYLRGDSRIRRTLLPGAEVCEHFHSTLALGSQRTGHKQARRQREENSDELTC